MIIFKTSVYVNEVKPENAIIIDHISSGNEHYEFLPSIVFEDGNGTFVFEGFEIKLKITEV